MKRSKIPHPPRRNHRHGCCPRLLRWARQQQLFVQHGVHKRTSEGILNCIQSKWNSYLHLPICVHACTDISNCRLRRFLFKQIVCQYNQEIQSKVGTGSTASTDVELHDAFLPRGIGQSHRKGHFAWIIIVLTLVYLGCWLRSSQTWPSRNTPSSKDLQWDTRNTLRETRCRILQKSSFFLFFILHFPFSSVVPNSSVIQ